MRWAAMRDTISGGRRFIGCREFARWSIAFVNLNAWDLRMFICERKLWLTVWENEWSIDLYLGLTEMNEGAPEPRVGLDPGNLSGNLPIKGGE
jgi:hypothetical protein